MPVGEVQGIFREAKYPCEKGLLKDVWEREVAAIVSEDTANLPCFDSWDVYHF